MTEPLTPMKAPVAGPGAAGQMRSLNMLTQHLRQGTAGDPVLSSGYALNDRIVSEILSNVPPGLKPDVDVRRPKASPGTVQVDVLGGLETADEYAKEALSWLPGVRLFNWARGKADAAFQSFREGSELSPEEQEAIASRETAEAKRVLQENEIYQRSRDYNMARMPDTEAMVSGIPASLIADPMLKMIADEATARNELKAQQDRNAEQLTLETTAANEQERKTYNRRYDYTARALRGLSLTAVSVPKAAAQLGQIVQELSSGTPEQQNKALQMVAQWENKIIQYAPTDRARDDEYWAKVAEGGGSFFATLSMGLAGKAMGLGATATTFLAGSLPMAAQQYDDADRFDATAMQKLLAWIGGSSMGALEMMPIMNAFGRANIQTGGAVSRIMANSAATSLEEAITEVIEEIGHDTIASLVYDPDREFDPDKYWETFWTMLPVGAAGGGIVQIAHDTIGNPTAVAEQEAKITMAGQHMLEVMNNQTEQRLAQYEEVSATDAVRDVSQLEPQPVAPEQGEALDPANAETVDAEPATPVEPEDAAVVAAEAALTEVEAAATEVQATEAAAQAAVDPEEAGAEVPALAEPYLQEIARNPEDSAELRAAVAEVLGATPEQVTALASQYAEAVEAEEISPEEALMAVVQDVARIEAIEAVRSTPAQPTAADYLARVEAPEVAFRGGSMPVNPRGAVEVTHWSPLEGLEVLDPKAFATGPVRGVERKRLFPGDPHYVPRTYYGVDAVETMPARELKKIPYEKRGKGGYIKEGGLGQNKYTAEIDPNRLYNWYEDPLGVKENLDRSRPMSEVVTQYEYLIRERGFDGIYFNQSQLGKTVIMFEPVVPVEAGSPGDFMAQAVKEKPVHEVLADKVPGLKSVFYYMTDEEKRRIRVKKSAENLVRTFEELPDADEFAAAAIAGVAKKGWYTNSANALVDMFGVMDAPRFAALLAATSPQTSVQSNLMNALSIWTGWVKAGRPTSVKDILRIMGANVQGDKGEKSILDAWKSNSIRALTAADPMTIALSGPKVNSFMLNLRHYVDEVTNDAWMANFAFIDQNVFKGSPAGGDETGNVYGKSPGYMAMSAVVRRAAEILTDRTGETWTPANVQETVWSWTKALTERAVKTGETARQILEAGGLTPEEVNDVPDFAGLFMQNVYRNILAEGGYDVDQLTQESNRGSSDGDGGGAATPQRPATRDAYSRIEDRTVRRMDEFIEARRPTRKSNEPEFDFSAVQEAKPQDFQNPQVLTEALRRPGYAMFTATQAALGPPDTEANRVANDTLIQRMQRAKIPFIPVEGYYNGEPDGQSFIAFTDQDTALALAREFNQESILTNRGLVFSTGELVEANHDDTVIGPEAKDRDFYSVLPDGTAVSVGLAEEDVSARDEMIAEAETVIDQATPEAQKILSETRVPERDMLPLPGLPQSSPGPIPSVVQAAQAYARSAGLPLRRARDYVKVDTNRARRIAQAYEEMEHNPEDPAVKAAFDAMIEETLAQFEYVLASGLDIDFIGPGQADPYPEGPKQVLEDLQRGHLWVFPTDQGFGTMTEAEATNPLLRETDYEIKGHKLVANDVFRIVHDFFGHGLEGAGFGARGEENAWQSHIRLYTDRAIPAVTTETRGQNSWVNYGPYGDQNRSNQRETVYADQKTGLMPEWTWTEGIADDPTHNESHEDDADLMALTSSTRDPYIGEQQDPGYIPDDPANQPAEGDEDLSLRQIANALIRSTGITVRQGRLVRRAAAGRVYGQWQRKTGVVRLRSWDDLSTLSHELGHVLHDTMGQTLEGWVRLNQRALQSLAKKTYPGTIDPKDIETQTREGFAELVRLYSMNPSYARRHFQPITEAFETFLQQNDPQLDETLKENARKVAAWINLPSVKRLTNIIVPARRPVGIEAAMKEIRDAGMPVVFEEWQRGLVKSMVDRYVPLKELSARLLNISSERGQVYDLKRADDPYVLARLSTNADSSAMVQTKYGVNGYRSLQPKTRGLRDVLMTIHGKTSASSFLTIDYDLVQEFDAYLVALRGLDEWRRFGEGKLQRAPIATKPPELRAIIAELDGIHGDKFRNAATMLNEYAMAQWQKSYDAGLIDKETYEKGNERQFYAPLQRDVSDKAALRNSTGGSVLGGKRLHKRFSGSDRDVISPMAVMMDKTFALERAIMANDIVKSIAKLAAGVGGAGKEVEQIPASRLQPAMIGVQEAVKSIAQLDTVTDEDAAELMTLLQGAADADERFTIFRAAQAAFAGDNVLFYWDKGKLAAIQLNDPALGAEVADLVTKVGHENMDFTLAFLVPFATAVRTTITSHPDFLLVNFIRDQVQSSIITNVGYVPFATGARGVLDELRQKEWARMYNQAYGRMGGVNVATLQTARVNRDLDALRNQGYLPTLFSDGYIKGLAKLTELTETGTRLGLFRKAYQRAKKDGLSDWDSAIEASYIATDIIDFGLSGDRMNNMRRIVPFLNVQLIGWHKFFRALGGDEVARRRGLGFALGAYFRNLNGLDLTRAERAQLRTGRSAWIKMTMMAITSAVWTAMMTGDEDYDNASDYLKTTGWVIPGSVFGQENRIYYVPKPFDTAVLSNLFERGMQRYYGDDTAMNRFVKGFLMTNVPPVSNPLVQTIWEQAYNIDTFRNAQIDPWYQQGLLPELRYNEYTSSFAKALGEEFGWSPNRIDHLFSSLGTSMYRDLTGLADMTDPHRPATTAAEIPIVRRFARKSSSGATVTRDFYDQVSSFGGRLEKLANSYKRYKDNGQEASAYKTLEASDGVEKAYMILSDPDAFGAEYLRMHPMKRAKDVASVVTDMKRDMVSELGLESTAEWRKYDDDLQIPMTARQKQQAIELLTEASMRTMNNAMVTVNHPAWHAKPLRDVASTVELLEALSPEVAEEFTRRLEKKKVYNERLVLDNWPELETRIDADGEAAFLSDLLTGTQINLGAF